MRRIGLVQNTSHANRFRDYLLTLGITAVAERDDASETDSDKHPHVLWVKDEQRVGDAKLALAEFLKSPDDARYSVSADAARIQAELEAENRKRLQNVKKVSHRALPGVGLSDASRPVVVLCTIAICVVIGVLTNFGRPRRFVTPQGIQVKSSGEKLIDAMWFVSRVDAAKSEDPFSSIRNGQVWRLITPALLHGNIGHLAMNMLGIFVLGGAIERLQGRRTMLLLLLITAIAGTVVQAVWPITNGGGPNGIGASGAAYGLLGYIWMRPFFDPEFELSIPPSGLILAMLFLLLGVAGVVPHIANGAHVGGLVGGIIAAKLFRTKSTGGSR